MRKHFFSATTCLLFLFFTSSLQIQPTTHEQCSGDQLLADLVIDQKNDVQSVVYLLNDVPYNGTAVRHMDGAESCILYIIENGVIVKRWGFFSNGILSREEYFKDGLPHGLSIQYFENGQKALETNYKSGVLHGNANKYAKDGSTLRVAKYNLGNLISEKF